MFIRSSSVRFKLVLFCVLIGLVPAAVVCCLTWYSASKLSDSRCQMLVSTARSIGDKIDRCIFERYGDVQAFGINRAVSEGWYERQEPEQIVEAMNRYMDTYDIYKLMIFVDLDGKPIAVNTVDKDNRPINSKQIYDRNYANTPWFRDSIAKRFYDGENSSVTGTVVEIQHIDEDVKQIYGNDEMTLGFAAPVYGKRGELIGVWKNEASFDLVKDIFKASYDEMKSSGLAETELTLLDSRGTVILELDPSFAGKMDFNHDPDIINKLNLAENGVLAAQQVVEGKEGFVTSSLHFRKQIWQAAGFSPLRGAMGFRGMPWNILVRLPQGVAMADVNQIRFSVLTTFGISIIAIMIASFFVGKWFVSPIQNAVDALGEITSGQWSKRLPRSGSDEFALLACRFNFFANLMQQAIGNALNQTSTANQSVVAMRSDMTQVSDTSVNVSSNMQEIAAAMTQMDLTIREIARNAALSSQVVSQASKTANNSNRHIEELGVAAMEIGKAVESIQEIAEQTNLLALNANIEAARAGDAGKGFSVVADEVRELARQTAAATDNIRRRVEAIQSTAQNSIQITKKITESIVSVQDFASTIAAAVEEQSVTTTSINERLQQATKVSVGSAEALKQAVETSHNVIRNIDKIDQLLDLSTYETNDGCLLEVGKA